MDFLRNKRKLEPLSNKKELFCQVNDWNCYDEFPEADEEDEVMWNNGMKFADTVSKQRDNWREVFDYEYRF